ncbi:MAG: prolyl oligopeptidase family serine peptidase [Candidatus Hodarchaeota archaeon]
MVEDRQILPYSKWIPNITPEQVFEEIISFNDVRIVNDFSYWSELRPAENGRIAVVCRNGNGEIYDVLPDDVNVRTRVHEYGGICWEVDMENIFYVNFEDQRLYRKTLQKEEQPVPITPERNEDGSLGKYAAPILTPDGKMLIFVYEKEYEEKENDNYIACLDITKNTVQEPTIIVKGKDFYFDPILSPDGNHIAWLQYDHPNMPWNSTELVLADFKDNSIVPGSEKIVAGGDGISICAIRFDRSGRLYFIMDEEGQPEDSPKNWWNLYQYDNGEIRAITQELAEFGLPMWVFRFMSWDFLPSNGRIVASYDKKGQGFLAIIDPVTRVLETLQSPFDEHYEIQAYSEHEIIFIGNCFDKPSALIKMDLQSKDYEIIKSSFTNPLSEDDISLPKYLEYPTSDGKRAYGLLYSPMNRNYVAPEGDKPPLIVMVHGGPTARSRRAFSVSKQYWTNQGYAIFDVDHRGSVSYGRRFRDVLKGRWGVIDAQDVKEAVDNLIEQGIVAPKVAITGGSAGGYAVQRALTLFPDTFQVGASYFGIGNLITLTKLIHKFESRYIDWLMGKSLSEPEGEKIYKERSPINHLDKLKSPMILFQGKDDKVVVPEVSREIAEILKEKGIFHEYIEYEGESHGFRKKENNIDSLTREATFFRKVLFEDY